MAWIGLGISWGTFMGLAALAGVLGPEGRSLAVVMAYWEGGGLLLFGPMTVLALRRKYSK